MGLKDTASKNFFGHLEVMASLLEYAFSICGIDKRIDKRHLRMVSGESYRITQGPDGRFRSENRYRDRLFEYRNGRERMSIGLELQSHKDDRMLPRIMSYDARRYGTLMKERRMHRIVNIVLNFDKNGVAPPDRLTHFMTSDSPELPDGLFYDYGFVSLNIYEMAENLELFRCNELRRVLYYFKLARERGPLVREMSTEPLSRDAALLCAVFLGLDIKIDDESEEIDMCKAVQDFKRECMKLGEKRGEKRGLEKGEKRGLVKGRLEKLTEIVQCLVAKGLSLGEIALLINTPKDVVEKLALSTETVM